MAEHHPGKKNGAGAGACADGIDHVPGGQQSGDGDRFTEAAVGNSKHAQRYSGQTGKLGRGGFQRALKKPRGYQRRLFIPGADLPSRKFLPYSGPIFQEGTDQSQTVLAQVDLLVEFNRRHRPPGCQIPFVGEKRKTGSQAGKEFTLAAFHLRDYISHFERIVRADPPFLKACHPDRNDRTRPDGRMQIREIRKRAVQMRAVVQTRREDHLRVNLDVVRRQEMEPVQNIARLRIAQAPRPHIRLGGVHGNVQRREMLLGNAVPIARGEIGQRDKVPVEERVAVIVVLDVQGAAHARRHLDDETKRAAVVAAADVGVEGRVGEIQAEGGPG